MGVSLGVSRENLRLAALAATLAAGMYVVVRAFVAEVALPALPWGGPAERQQAVVMYEPAAAGPIDRPRVLVDRSARVAPDRARVQVPDTAERARRGRGASAGSRGETSRSHGGSHVGVTETETPRAKPRSAEPRPTQTDGTTSANGGTAAPAPTLKVPTVTTTTDPVTSLTAPLEPVVTPVVEKVDATLDPVLADAPDLALP